MSNSEVEMNLRGMVTCGYIKDNRAHLERPAFSHGQLYVALCRV
jgi:hypothetical protein